MRIYPVELSTTVYVVAESPRDAERVAMGDVDLDDIDFDYSSGPAVERLDRVPKDERDSYPYGTTDDYSIEEWLTSGGDPRGARERTRNEWLATRPAAISDLPAWFAMAPEIEMRVTAQHGERAMASDGHGLIAAEGGRVGASGKPLSAGDVDRFIVPRDGDRARSVAASALRAWVTRSERVEEYGTVYRCVRAGEATLDAALVERWLFPVLDILGEAAVTVRTLGAEDPAIFSGDGWTVAIMPLRREASAAAALDEVSP